MNACNPLKKNDETTFFKYILLTIPRNLNKLSSPNFSEKEHSTNT